MPANAAVPSALTTVVNYWPTRPAFSVPEPTSRERTISGGPIYKLAAVRQLACDQKIVLSHSRKLSKDLENLEWGLSEIQQSIAVLTPADYRKSMWCKSGQLWLPCDDYVLEQYSEPHFEPPRPIDLYLKFAIAPSGAALVFVSCHPA